jgi:hypothetical protein
MTMTARDTYIDNMKLELDKLNEQLSALEAKAAHAGRDAHEQYEIELVKLRAHSQDALTKWEELTAASEHSWQQWVSDMNHMRDAFNHAFRGVKARV